MNSNSRNTNGVHDGFQELRLDGDVPRNQLPAVVSVVPKVSSSSSCDDNNDGAGVATSGFAFASSTMEVSSTSPVRGAAPPSRRKSSTAVPPSTEGLISPGELTAPVRKKSASAIMTPQSPECSSGKDKPPKNISAEWALSSGEDFNFDEDFEVEENEVEEGLEAIPTLNFPAKIDEEDLVDALSMIDDDDEGDAGDDEDDASGGGSGGGGTAGGIIILEEEQRVSEKTEVKPMIVRIPLVADRRSCSPSSRVVLPTPSSNRLTAQSSNAPGEPTTRLTTSNNSVYPAAGGELKFTPNSTSTGEHQQLPRFFQTTVTAKKFSDNDNETKNTVKLSPRETSPTPFGRQSPLQQQQQPQQLQQSSSSSSLKPNNGPTNRARRVPTLPSLPPARPKEKSSLFGDFFGGKNKSETSETAESGGGSGGSDALDKMKTKISSAFNNVKYGWTIKTKTDFRTDAAIWLLGELYHPALDLSASGSALDSRSGAEEDSKASTRKILDMFKSDFTSRIWFTYRREFPVLAGSNLTTDCGWGCMLRSMQMMLAQSFVVHFMGRDWRLFDQQDRTQEAFHRQIIKWFGDSPSDLSPFSVHRLVKVGRTLGKKAGDWYGPSSVAYIAREAMQSAYTFNPILGQIRIYVAKDCTIYIPDVDELCRKRQRLSFSSSCESNSEDRSILPYHLNARSLSQKAKAARRASKAAAAAVKEQTPPGDEAAAPPPAEAEEEWKTALLLLVPVRLGGETLNESAYLDCLKSLLALKQSCGIIGGRPKHSLYFVGYQEDRLIHLDPHFCQDVVDFSQRDFPLHTFHCVSPRKMLSSKMDPSCTFGFYLRSKAEFDKFVTYVNEILGVQPKGNYPMFVFSNDRMEDVENETMRDLGDLDGDFVVDAVSGRASTERRHSLDDEDDYVLL